MRLSRRSRRAALAPLLVLGACADAGTGPPIGPVLVPALVPVPARDGSPLQSDALDYELRYVAWAQYLGRVVVTYQNAGSAPIYLDRLWPSARTPVFSLVEAWPGSYDVRAYQIFTGVGSPAIIVPPGAVRVDTLALDLQDIGQPSPDPRLAGRSGVVRLRLAAYARMNGFGEVDIESPLAEFVSNPFRVRFIRSPAG